MLARAHVRIYRAMFIILVQVCASRFRRKYLETPRWILITYILPRSWRSIGSIRLPAPKNDTLYGYIEAEVGSPIPSDAAIRSRNETKVDLKFRKQERIRFLRRK